jgi:hypothetical protein
MSEQGTVEQVEQGDEAPETTVGSRRVVLRRDETSGWWREVETVSSRNEDHAIDLVAGRSGDPKCKPGAYKAIPASQWAGYRGVER